MSREFDFEIAFCEGLLQRQPEDRAAMEMLASYYTRCGRIADGLALDERLVRLDPDNPTCHYNLACSLALTDRVDEALAALESAIGCGYQDFRWMAKDPDLRSLRRDRRFAALLRKLRAAAV
jgi:predicted Zn-dependent protease